MNCPYCGHAETTVVESAPLEDSVRRRRECHSSKCGKRFTTFEIEDERHKRLMALEVATNQRRRADDK